MRGRGTVASSRLFGASVHVALCAVALAVLLAPAAANGRSSISPGDRRATHAYLLARYEFERATAANVGASDVALAAYIARVGGECPSVLAGTPSTIIEPKTPAETAAGAHGREQLFQLLVQVQFASIESWFAPDQSANLRFAAVIARLRWSEPQINRAAYRSATALRAFVFGGAGTSLCADLRSWVQSGYRTLSPASTAFLSGGLEHPTVSGSSEPERTLDEFVSREESPRDRLLVRRYRKLIPKLRRAIPSASVLGQLSRELGLHMPVELSSLGSSNPDSIFIGSASTDAGTRFVASASRPSASEPNSCEPTISIEEALPDGGQSEHSASGCGPSPNHEPLLSCEAGQLRVTAILPAAAHSAILTLSDGRQITSSVFTVPANAGGPAGFYYQAVRGPSPIPVSLSELNEAGATLAVVKLKPLVECTQHPHKTLSGPRTLVHAHAPGGQSFSIVVERFSELGQTKVTLDLKVGRGDTGGEILGGPARALSWQLASGCTGGSRYWIVFGILHNSASSVYARSGSRLVALTAVRLPASLHTAGALVYGAVPSSPSAIVLRDASGRTVGSASLSRPHGVPRPRRCSKPLPRGEEEGVENTSGTIVGHSR